MNRRSYAGENNPHWRGGITRRTKGHNHIRYFMPRHPRADSIGYVLAHIIEAEKKLGRPLDNTEVVHHIDGDASNNNYDNLFVCSSQAEHAKIHDPERKRKSNGTFA